VGCWHSPPCLVGCRTHPHAFPLGFVAGTPIGSAPCWRGIGHAYGRASSWLGRPTSYCVGLKGFRARPNRSRSLGRGQIPQVWRPRRRFLAFIAVTGAGNLHPAAESARDWRLVSVSAAENPFRISSRDESSRRRSSIGHSQYDSSSPADTPDPATLPVRAAFRSPFRPWALT